MAVVLENNRSYFIGGTGQLYAKLETTEGFTYESKSVDYGRLSSTYAPYPAVPLGFRIQIGSFYFRVGEKTHPSNFILLLYPGYPIASVGMQNNIGPVSLPVDDTSKINAVKVGIPFNLPPIPPSIGQAGAPAILRTLTVDSSNLKNNSLQIGITVENKSVGEGAQFLIHPWAITSKGFLSEAGKIDPFDYCFPAACPYVGPGLTQAYRIIFDVAGGETIKYLIFHEYTEGREIYWVVALDK